MVGHIPLDVQALQLHMLSISAHKFYGPKGIGVLYRRRSNPRVQLAPVIYGGGHERGLRSGTLNVPAIVGMGKAAALAKREMGEEEERFRAWTQQMHQAFVNALGDGVALNGHPTERLPHNLNVSFAGVESRALIVQLPDVAIATGSACTWAQVEPSHVIAALGFGEARARSALRISVGRMNTDEEIRQAIDNIVRAVQKLHCLIA